MDEKQKLLEEYSEILDRCMEIKKILASNFGTDVDVLFLYGIYYTSEINKRRSKK